MHSIVSYMLYCFIYGFVLWQVLVSCSWYANNVSHTRPRLYLFSQIPRIRCPRKNEKEVNTATLLVFLMKRFLSICCHLSSLERARLSEAHLKWYHIHIFHFWISFKHFPFRTCCYWILIHLHTHHGKRYINIKFLFIQLDWINSCL